MKHLLLIVGVMTAVTYLPRLAPFYLLDRFQLPKSVQRILEQVPYAALGALVFPGVLNAYPGEPLLPLAGLGATLVIAWLRGGLILSVLGAVAAVYLMR